MMQRRCTQRQFLLRPDAKTNNAFVYTLAEAAKRFGVQVILPQMMSNHYHSAVVDPEGTEVEFRERFHKLMAKSQNALRGRWENMWAAEEPCTVEVACTEDDLLEKLVYIACNPVLDGLVDRVDHWPGPRFLQALLTGRPLRATRPKHFFREHGDMPLEVELELKLPDYITDKPQFLEKLKQRVAEVETRCLRERMSSGKRVVGRRTVKRQYWGDSPSSREPRRTLRPRVAARSKWHRIALLQRNKLWEAAYRRAYERWRDGDSTAEFPYGTYRLRVFGNVHVRPGLPDQT
jgi:hypothetical protein